MTEKIPQIIDTHLHLDLFDNPDRILEEAKRLGIGLVAMTNAPFLFEACRKICKKYSYAWTSLGMHPELFYDLLDLTSFVGEIGLDFTTRDETHQKAQKMVFEKILSFCSNKKNKILSVHSRKAEKDIIEIIGKHYPNKIVMHWYSGSILNLEKAIENGFYFSINSSMVMAKNGQERIKRIPNDKILLETDGPFIKNNCTHLTIEILEFIIDKIAITKGICVKDIKLQIQKNQQQIFHYISK
jgi:TatD DNase family protein